MRIRYSAMAVVVSTFYKFVRIEDCEALRAALGAFCCARAIKGTILIAPEGLNATVSGSAEAIAELHAELRGDPRFCDLATKESSAARHPFDRLKVKIKSEIVTFGQSSADPSRRVGRYVKPERWNDLIDDPDVVLIDTRNDYEVGIGTFAGALNPQTKTFSEFPDFVTRELQGRKKSKIAMFCTGGIRCEKASSYLMSIGYETVFHLEGGILKYLESVPAEDSRWRGECFVFDGRVALEHGVLEGSHVRCDTCGSPVHKAAGASACFQCVTREISDTPASRRSE